MCEICRQEPCSCHCPNYMPPRTYLKCHLCKDKIQIGEEYIESYDGKYAHLECCGLFSTNEMLEFLDIKIKRMENE